MDTNFEHTWVFLSHSNEDFKKLRIVRNRLEELNFRPLLFFLKCLENDDDETIMELIKREINARERFILCQSTNSLRSPWVQKEVDYIKSTGRPYEIIDLEAPSTFNERLNRFDQRSSLYIWSTEDQVANKVAELTTLKAFKVNVITEFSLSKATSVEQELLMSNILKGAYLMVLVSRNLKRDETAFLNKLAKRRGLKALAYMCGFDGIDNDTFGDGLNDNIFCKKTIDGMALNGVVERIVNDLMDYDRRLFNGEMMENPKPEKQQRIDKKDFAKRLRIYLESHRDGISLKPIDKRLHKDWLDDSAFQLSVKKDYFNRLNLKKMLDLINRHVSKKDLYFSSVYDCTDLEILLWALEELLVTDKKGSMSSALCYYITHLLEANGIFI